MCAFLKGLILFERQTLSRKRNRSSIHWFTPQPATMARTELLWNWQPGAASESPVLVQGPKNLNHCPLLSQIINKQLDQKRNSWDINQHPYTKSVPQLQGLACGVTMLALMFTCLTPSVHKGYSITHLLYLNNNSRKYVLSSITQWQFQKFSLSL